MYHFFKSEFFNFEFIRTLGTVPFGAADTAECLDAAAEIRSDNPETWSRAWKKQADKAAGLFTDAVKAGDRVAARDACLRASNYYRAAQYMFSDRPGAPEPRVLPFFMKSTAYFREALHLLDVDVKTLRIPTGDGHILPGYLYLPPKKNRLPGKIPVLINCGGADSTQEELYSLYPAGGTDRGYAVVTFEGPGQGIVLRRDRLTMRPDWEVVIRWVLDHLQSLVAEDATSDVELDMERVAVAGASMGAYYALRAAADPRVAACVAIDPIYDMWDLATDRLPAPFLNAWLSGWLSDGVFNALFRSLARFSFQLHWELSHCMWIFGVSTPAQAFREMRRWTLRGETEAAAEFPSRIRCPVLVSGAAATIYTAPEISTMRVVAALSDLPEAQKEVWVSTEPADGGLQAKVGAWKLVQQRTFAFLDSQFGHNRPPLDVQEVDVDQGIKPLVEL